MGARLGVIWIGVMGFFAVFAPWIANSHPFVMKKADGQLSYPLFVYLTAADVTLLIVAVASVVLYFLKRLSLKRKIGILLLITLIVGAACAFLVQPPKRVVYDEYRVQLASGEIQWAVHTIIPFSPSDRLRDQPGKRLSAPTAEHWFGTETDGADVLSRMIHACRIALAVGFIATGIAVVIGVFVGGMMGFFSGVVDLLGMRIVEIFSAIPVFFLLLTFVAFFDRNLYIMMVIIGITGWVGYARFIRAEFLKLRQQDFVQAAIACGLPIRSILFKHMLPNGVAPVLVEASFGVASAILYESTLSFLGLGLVDEPSWGQMLSQATGAGGGFIWWIAWPPIMAIFLTVFAYNLVGESLRDAIDPQLKKAAQL
jgi:peptide/nickel transport system permease protein